MATYTVTVKDNCGGEHIHLYVKRDGVTVQEFGVTKSQLLDRELSWEEVIPFFLREAIKRAGATTLAQAKIAVESASWVF